MTPELLHNYGKYLEKSLEELKHLHTVVLFGNGYAGAIAQKALSAMNKATMAIADNNITLQKNTYFNIPVLPPEEAYIRFPDSVIYLCLFNKENEKYVTDQLIQTGFKEIRKLDVLLYAFLIYCRKFMPEEAFRLLVTLNLPYAENLTFFHIGLSVTQICTMNCKDCCAFIPYIEKKKHFHKDVIFNSMKYFLNNIDGVYSIGLVGGEALLHPDIIELCEALSDYKNVLSIRIATNGRKLPSLDYKKLGTLGVIIDLRDYGIMSTEKNKFIKVFEDNNIGYDIVTESNDWYAIKPYTKYKKLSNPSISHISECYFGNCNTIVDNQFFKCAVAAMNQFVGKDSPVFEYDYVYLSQKNKNIRHQLMELKQRTRLDACSYCSFSKEKRVPIAIQEKERI